MMRAIRMRLGAELRTRWRASVGLALLVGLAGGVVLASTAGARRTASSFTRLVRANNVADVVVNPDAGTGSALTPAKLEGLPNVVEAATINGLLLISLTPAGYPDFALSPVILAGTDTRAVYRLQQPRIIAGRLSDPAKADETMVDITYAQKMKLKAGSVLKMYTPVDLQHFAITPEQGPPPLMQEFRFTVTGVFVEPYDIVVDQGFQGGYVNMTPAFWNQHPLSAGYWGEAIKLRHGAADVPAFRAAVQSLVPNEAIAFQTLPVTRDKTQRAIRPQADALVFFAIAVALAGVLIAGQALSRQLFVESSDHPVLSAIGFSRGQLFALGMLRAAIVGIAAAGIAVVVAASGSGLFPIGPANLAEPRPGPSLDLPVLLLGGAGVVVAVLLLGIVPSLRGARGFRARDAASANPSRLADALSRSGASAPAIVGVRLAVEPGRGRTAVPVRTTIAAAAIGIASVMAALTFGTGLTHLVATPPLYGWNWHVLLQTQADNPADAERRIANIETALAADGEVAGWSRASISEVVFNGRSVVTIGVETVKGAVLPTVAGGRVPRTDAEVALGSVTMRKLHVSIGDTVTAAWNGTERPLKIVGRVVLPGLGNYPGADKTALGEGAVLTRPAVLELGPRFGVSVLVGFRPDTAPGAAAEHLQLRLNKIPLPPGGNAPTVSTVERPSDVQNYSRVRATPIILAGILGLLAIAAVAHVLGAAVRRRSRDLAVLKTMGMVRRQVRATVAWQASIVALVALAIGVPAGVAAGRWAWSAFATQLGTVAEPRVPVLLVALALPAVLIACNLVAALPGRRAARTPPALVLRTE